MLTPDNRVILTDFGLARLAFTGVGTRSSMVLCTPAYAPPELVAGVSELDYRADLFSFGVMLYQVLADRQPWSTERSNQPASFFCDKPPDPIGGDIPPEIERLVVSLLAESPSDRPGSAAEVARTLERHVASTVGEVVQNVRRSPPRVRLEPVLAPEATPSWILEGLTERLREGLRRAGMTSRHGDQGSQVDAVVEATLISGEGLELSLQVTSFANGLRLWSGNIISSQNDLVALCDQALATLVETLFEAPIVRTSLARSPDVEAQELHLRGRYVLRHFWFEDVSEAITYLEQAHERAPEDPAILVDLAVGLARHSELSKDNTLLLDRAWMLAIQARDSAPQWADSWLALAMVAFQAGRWSLTLQHARYALSLEPDLAAAHELIGTILAETGPLSDARWHFVRALQLDDQLFRSIVGLWRVEALLGNSAQARQTLTRLEAMEGVVDWARIIERRHYIWFDPERARRIPVTFPPRGPAEAVQAFSACLEAFSQSAPLPQEALDGFFSTLENAPRINRQQLINAQGIIEMLAKSGGSWEQAYPLLKILASAGLRDLMWLAHAPVFAQWRLDKEFQGIEADLRRRTT